VYAWGYWPLMALSSLVGTVGLVFGRSSLRMGVTLSMCLVAVAATIQLIPLGTHQLSIWSPHALSIVLRRNLQFAIAGVGEHPLSVEPQRTRLAIAFWVSFCLLLLGMARSLNRDSARRIAAALTGLGALLGMVGIIQMSTFTGKIYGVWDLTQGGSPFGPFINKNHFAGWMLMAIPVALGYFMALVSRGMTGRKRGFRDSVLWFGSPDASLATLAAFAIILMAMSLVFTLSRSGITALTISLMIAVPVMARRQIGYSRRVVVASFAVMLAIAVVSWVGLDQIIRRFAEAEITGLDERPAIWGDTVRIIRDFWLTGSGLNTFGVVTPFYQTSVPGQHLREAHNDYLQLLAEGGLLLTTPILLTILTFGRAIRHRLRQDEGSIWWIRIGALTGLSAIALQSVVEFSLQIPGNAVLCAVLAGLAIHNSEERSRIKQSV
jgi:O-antigen ligase